MVLSETAGIRSETCVPAVPFLTRRLVPCGSNQRSQMGRPPESPRVEIFVCSDDAPAAGRSTARPVSGKLMLSHILASCGCRVGRFRGRSEEHTSELQSLLRISYAV